MKRNKAFLAKVLAVAVTITSILPSSALTANAAIKVVTETTGTNREAVESNWSAGDVDDFFEEQLLIGEGMQTWNFDSSKDSNPGSGNGDFSASGASAVVYASKQDIKSREGMRRTMSFDCVSLQQSALRFGILLKYVDATHWVYLGYDQPAGEGGGNYWFLEWKNGEDGSWTSTSLGNLNDIQMAAGSEANWTRVKIVYEDAENISVTVTPVSYNAETKEYTENVAGRKSAELNYSVFSALREYADENDMPIHFGFKGGNFGNNPTKINITNVKMGELPAREEPVDPSKKDPTEKDPTEKDPTEKDPTEKDPTEKDPTEKDPTEKDPTEKDPTEKDPTEKDVTDKDASPKSAGAEKVAFAAAKQVARTDDDEVENEVALSYANCGWKSPKSGTDPKEILIRDPKGEFVVYSSIISSSGEVLTAHDTGLTDFAEGTVSAVLRPYTELSDDPVPAFYLGAKGEDGTGIQVGYDGTNWVSVVDGTKTTLSNVSVPVEGKTDYKLTLTVNKEGKLTAKVQRVTPKYGADEGSEANGAEVTLVSDVDVSTLDAGSISLATDGLLRVRNVNYTSVTYGPVSDALKNRYNYTTIMEKTNTDNVYYTDKWTEFITERDVHNTFLESDAEVTEKSAIDALAGIKDAWTALDVAANKTATGKAALEEAKADAEAIIAEEAYYDVADWAAYKAAVSDAAALIAKLGTEGVASTEVSAALAALDVEATPKKVSSSDLAAYNSQLNKIKSDVDGKLTPNAEYTAALNRVEALLKDANATKKDVDEAFAALEAAKAKLSAVTPTPVPTPVDTVKKGDKKVVSSATYVIDDVAKKTVTLSKYTGKASKMTVNTVKIGNDTYKVTKIAKNAFKNNKKLQTLIIGKNVTSIAGNAFTGAKKLKSVEFKNAKTKVAKNAFKKTPKKIKVKVPKSLKKNKKNFNKFKSMIKKSGMKGYKI